MVGCAVEVPTPPPLDCAVVAGPELTPPPDSNEVAVLESVGITPVLVPPSPPPDEVPPIGLFSVVESIGTGREVVYVMKPLVKLVG